VSDHTAADDLVSAALGVSPPEEGSWSRNALELEASGDWVLFDTLADQAISSFSERDLDEVLHVPSSVGGTWEAERVDLAPLGPAQGNDVEAAYMPSDDRFPVATGPLGRRQQQVSCFLCLRGAQRLVSRLLGLVEQIRQCHVPSGVFGRCRRSIRRRRVTLSWG
jgi:hypothetical protein